MPEDSRAGIGTHWINVGQGPRPALFLHCSLASSRALRPVMERLGTDLSMTAIDLPGHGQSADWDQSGDFVARATDVAETFCDGPRDIVGHSLGAVVALSLMVRRPDLVRSAVLVEPVLFAAAKGSDAYRTYQQDHAPIIQAIASGDAEAATRAFTGIWGAPQPWDALPPPVRTAMTDRIPLVAATEPALDDDANGVLAPERLEAVTAPVMLIRGGRSHPVIPAIFDTLSRRLPNMRIEVVQGAGHMAPITHPQEVADLVRAHLELCDA
ncbi:alpha/beta fold hydrolase [Palleronia sp.]|uniref:alpha/beta fold hydrolase n=1 Tax=Palleronia sp. TaxID=1940284 RepID=UPI0035C83A79